MNAPSQLLASSYVALGGAIGALLRYFRSEQANEASRAIYESVMEIVYDGIKTPDLGGSATTSEFTDQVIARVKKKLEIWDTLGE